MDIATAVAIVGTTGVVAGSGASILRTLFGKPFCKEHIKLMDKANNADLISEKLSVLLSDIASVKSALMTLVITSTEDTPEGKALREKVIDLLMKRN